MRFFLLPLIFLTIRDYAKQVPQDLYLFVSGFQASHNSMAYHVLQYYEVFCDDIILSIVL